jgi:hypothetical protein
MIIHRWTRKQSKYRETVHWVQAFTGMVATQSCGFTGSVSRMMLSCRTTQTSLSSLDWYSSWTVSLWLSHSDTTHTGLLWFYLRYHLHWITVVLSQIPLTQVATSWHDVTPTLGPRHLHLGSDISRTDTELCRSHGLAQVWTTSTALYPRVVGPSLPSAVGLGHHTVDLRPSPTLRLSYTVDVRTTTTHDRYGQLKIH